MAFQTIKKVVGKAKEAKDKVIDSIGEGISRRTDTRVLSEIRGMQADMKREHIMANRERRRREGVEFIQTSDGKMKMRRTK